MDAPYSILQILWSTDPMTQRAIGMVLGLGLISAVTLFLPLFVRLSRLFLFERRLRDWVRYSASLPNAKSKLETAGAGHHLDHDEMRELFADSPISAAYEEFERRWKTAELSDGIDRAPIRLMDIFDERPLLPFGPRRSLLPVMPGLFLGVGVFAALIGLIPGLAGPAGDPLTSDTQSAWMAAQLGLALRASAWGFICAIGATLSGRLIEGAFDARSHALDQIVEDAFGSVSPGELAEITRQTQQRSLDTLGKELRGFASELTERLDRGLQRIEQSTARSANLVSQEQRGALHTIVQELSLSVRQGVEHHLGELRSALQRAVEHQSSVTGGLAETFERMVENSKTQDRVARTLADSASSVEAAAHAMRGSAVEMQPILEHLSTTSRGLADTAKHISNTQTVVARAAEGVRSSLEHAAAGVDDQRQFLEVSLKEIRQVLAELGDGLGTSLQRSLHEVDDVLGSTIGRLTKTLAESNETIERMAGPIRAAEGTTRETHVALDRVRSEVEALGEWMSQAVKPLRTGIVEVSDRAEDIARGMAEFTTHTRQIDKTMEALRVEIHEESRRLQGTGSELSRRLKLASDTVGRLEGTRAISARRPKSESPRMADEQSGSPPFRDHRAESPYTQIPADRDSSSAGAIPSSRPADFESPANRTYDPDPDPDPVEPPNASEAADREERDAGNGNDPHETGGHPIASSGFRLGTAPAQGPDPYSRFTENPEAPSNPRNFQVGGRELGDDLKLSDLLSRNPGDEKKPTASKSTRPETKSKNASDPRDESSRSSDDSE